MKEILNKIINQNLIYKITIGLFLGILLATIAPNFAKNVSILGEIFTGALKAIAPILVFFLVINSIAFYSQKNQNIKSIKFILILYITSTFLSALTAVCFSYIFPTKLILEATNQIINAPENIIEVLKTFIVNIFKNPLDSLLNANYISILFWSIIFGFTLKKAKQSTKDLIDDITTSTIEIVIIVIKFAPIGIFGLVASSIAKSGLTTLLIYIQLIGVLVSCILFVALVVNPIITYLTIKENPYPLVFTTLKESGITAFFTRSSSANIPTNLNICEKLGLEKSIYSIAIPLGSAINMAGAAITITILTLSCVHTLNIQIDFLTVLLFSFLTSICACGASGVVGGSLLLIPLSCSLFGISNDISIQVVAIGFIIGVIQDSFETALNSSSDVLFTAANDIRNKKICKSN